MCTIDTDSGGMNEEDEVEAEAEDGDGDHVYYGIDAGDIMLDSHMPEDDYVCLDLYNTRDMAQIHRFVASRPTPDRRDAAAAFIFKLMVQEDALLQDAADMLATYNRAALIARCRFGAANDFGSSVIRTLSRGEVQAALWQLQLLPEVGQPLEETNMHQLLFALLENAHNEQAFHRAKALVETQPLSTEDVHNALFYVGFSGNIEAAEWLLTLTDPDTETPVQVYGTLFEAACAKNHFPMVQWLWERGVRPHKSTHVVLRECFYGVLRRVGLCPLTQWLAALIAKEEPETLNNTNFVWETFLRACCGGLSTARWALGWLTGKLDASVCPEFFAGNAGSFLAQESKYETLFWVLDWLEGNNLADQARTAALAALPWACGDMLTAEAERLDIKCGRLLEESSEEGQRLRLEAFRKAGFRADISAMRWILRRDPESQANTVPKWMVDNAALLYMEAYSDCESVVYTHFLLHIGLPPTRQITGYFLEYHRWRGATDCRADWIGLCLRAQRLRPPYLSLKNMN
jgi:hypothetical protein